MRYKVAARHNLYCVFYRDTYTDDLGEHKALYRSDNLLKCYQWIAQQYEIPLIQIKLRPTMDGFTVYALWFAGIELLFEMFMIEKYDSAHIGVRLIEDRMRCDRWVNLNMEWKGLFLALFSGIPIMEKK